MSQGRNEWADGEALGSVGSWGKTARPGRARGGGKVTDPLHEQLEILHRALELEREGREFYLDAANIVSSSLARSVFLMLADEEERHQAAIEGFSNSMAVDGKYPLFMASEWVISNRAGRLSSIAELARKALGGRVAAAVGELEAYNRALELERTSLQLYQRELQRADTPTAKEFYRYLVEQEHAHYRILEKALDFLQGDHQGFFAELGVAK